MSHSPNAARGIASESLGIIEQNGPHVGWHVRVRNGESPSVAVSAAPHWTCARLKRALEDEESGAVLTSRLIFQGARFSRSFRKHYRDSRARDFRNHHLDRLRAYQKGVTSWMYSLCLCGKATKPRRSKTHGFVCVLPSQSSCAMTANGFSGSGLEWKL